ncbi:MAG: GH39 family glycosyl hydrolase, partial [Streptomyces sp.]
SVDQEHSHIKAVWDELDGGDWPDEQQWERLRAADRLSETSLEAVTADSDGTVSLTVDLPMPGIRALRLTRA